MLEFKIIKGELYSITNGGPAIPVDPSLGLSVNDGDFILQNEYETDSSGRLILAYIGGREYVYDKRKSERIKQRKLDALSVKREPARAPYNFISLNAQIKSTDGITDHSKYIEDTLSGFIDLHIKNTTPFYIRGWNKKTKEASEEFFSAIDGKPIIPGSSLRGMLRNLVEIVSWSHLDIINKDRRLFHRGMFKKELSDEYAEERFPLTQNDPNAKLNETVGYLRYEQNEFKIYPARCLGESYTCRNIDYQLKSNEWHVFPGKAPGGRNKGWKISFPSTNVKALSISESFIRDYQEDVYRGKNIPNLLKCAKDLNSFQEYVSKGWKVEIVQKFGIPVFYEEKADKITSFGHCRNYRIPYNKTISEFISQEWEDQTKPNDFVSSIFGSIGSSKVKDAASKIYVEDGFAIGEVTYETRAITKTLLSPKPTTFQHYVEQPNGTKTALEHLKHWSQESTIRGYKQYWHRKTYATIDKNGWKQKENIPENYEVKDTAQRPIKAIKNASFVSRIRFNNLSEAELGCLLFVLDLKEGMHHKLGLGKPLGLGSIHITPSLSLCSRKNRYSTLFVQKNDSTFWNTAKHEEQKLNNYKDAFATNILQAKKTWHDLWKQKRLTHLETMLSFNHDGVSNFLDRTRYMEIEYKPAQSSPYFTEKDVAKDSKRVRDFKQVVEKKNEYIDRPVLPYPNEVIDPNTYNKL